MIPHWLEVALCGAFAFLIFAAACLFLAMARDIWRSRPW